MKKVGTKKEVYLGIALKTYEGVTRDDIIKALKGKSKKINLSKKVYGKMTYTNPLISNKKRNITKKKNNDLGKLNVSDLKERLNRERKLERLKRRKLKSLKGKGMGKKNKGKKLSFALNKNKTKEFYCTSLNKEDDIFTTSYFNGYERDDEDDNIKIKKKEFQIEEPPNISLDELFI